MAKKKSTNKAAVKEAKKTKLAQKATRKDTKKHKKTNSLNNEVDNDDDLEGILDRMRLEWEEKHRVTEETVEGPPSRRANATLTADPSGNHLWCVGGEFFSEDGKAHFYNDVFRYSPEKNEWRRFTSATCPGPRSAHAVVASPVAGGKLFLFGGEFSSLHQTTFHHYRDTWVFDITSKSWERIETKLKPSARSGHRMAIWKHYIVLFGGFYDPGIRTQYLNDLWVFDIEEFTWKHIEFRDGDRKPSPRSGFSFIPAPEGLVLYGGYCKEYVKGKRAQGIALEDTWFLRMSMDLKELKWERRKKVGYAPSLRSGCTMALWASKDTGVLFGGVKDEEQSEETLTSEFYNDLYGYLTPGNGKWRSFTLKKPKRKPNVQRQDPKSLSTDYLSDSQSDEEHDGGNVRKISRAPVLRDNEDMTEESQAPVARCSAAIDNAMLAVLRNTLYIYGGILERGNREITLDDFWSIALDKLDAFCCLKPLEVDVVNEGDTSSSEDEDGSSGDSDSDEGDDGGSVEEPEDGDGDTSETNPASKGQTDAIVPNQRDIRSQAQSFMNAADIQSPESALSTPLPGETLAAFYARTRDYWAQQAHVSSDNRGKLLRRDGFGLAEERYMSYKPVLEEVEKILQEAGLDADEVKKVRSPNDVPPGSASRNRR